MEMTRGKTIELFPNHLPKQLSPNARNDIHSGSINISTNIYENH